MCKPIPVPYAKLEPFHRRCIASAYHNEINPSIKCVKQFDGSWWILAPTGTPNQRIRSAINLRKKHSPKIYFTEFPFSVLLSQKVAA